MTFDSTGAADPLDQRILDFTRATVELAGDAPKHDQGLQALARLSARWHSPRVPVVIVGEVSRGKSTLINALLGQRLLPTDFRTLSSTWVHLRYHTHFSAVAYVQQEQGDIIRAPMVTEEDLSVYLTVNGADLLVARHGHGARVLSVEIGLPAPLLASGLELIDTPGVGGLRAAHRHAALAGLIEADAIIFVTKPGEPLSASERRFLAEAVDRVAECIIVQTHRDAETPANADQALLDDLATLADPAAWTALFGDPARGQRLAERFASVPAASVSAEGALKAYPLAPGDIRERRIATSNIGLLHELITSRVVAHGGRLHRRNLVRLNEVVLTELKTRTTQRRVMLSDEAAAAVALDDRSARITRWMAHNGDFWQAEYNLWCDRIPAAIGEFARMRADELHHEYAHAFEHMSGDEIKAAGEALAQAPGAALAEMMQIARTHIDEAVRRVRGLLSSDGPADPLVEMEQTKAVFARLPGVGASSAGIEFDWEDLRVAAQGGVTGVGVTAAGAIALQHAGWLIAGGMVPVVWPFLIGSAIFVGIHQWRRHKQRTVTQALELLAAVQSQITGTAVTVATGASRAAKEQMASEIRAALAELRDRVEQDRRDLAESSRMSPEERVTRVGEADDKLRRCDEQLGQIADLVAAVG